MSVSQYRPAYDQRTGAFSQWCSGSVSTSRYVFLSYLTHVFGEPESARIVHTVYALPRYVARRRPYLMDYEFERRVPRKAAKLVPAGTRTNFAGARAVPLSLLVENPDAHEAIMDMMNRQDQDELASRRTRGLSSMFETALECSNSILHVGAKAGGAAEVETRIYCQGALDITLHSLFRIGTP